MILSLNDQSFAHKKSRFLIIGGGTAGLILGHELAKLDLGEVVVLEAGGTFTVHADEIFPKIKFNRSIYNGASLGRFGGLGGTSARWGGAMLPFLEADFHGQFKELIKDASKFVSQIEDIFSIPTGSYEDIDSIKIPNYTTRKAKWPKFSKRNISTLLSKELKNEKNLIIYTDAKFLDFEIQNSRIVSAEAINSDFKRFHFFADHFIICAGAIETTRIMLELEAKSNLNSIKSTFSTTGLYFSDHLSVKIGTLIPVSRKKLNKFVGYQFDSLGSMSNIRFELDALSEYRHSVPPHFIHVSFDLSTPGGFSTIREILRYLQERRFPPITLFVKLIRFMPWFLRAAWWRFVVKRLLYPENAEIQMHLVMEQFPTPENKIFLSDKIDRELKSYNLEMSWGVSERDKQNLVNILELVKKSFKESELAKLAKLEFQDSNDIMKDLDLGGGIFHPTGSTRVAFGESGGTVDTDLKVLDYENLYLLSTSVFNSGGGSNPTMTQLMLGLRLAKFLGDLSKFEK